VASLQWNGALCTKLAGRSAVLVILHRGPRGRIQGILEQVIKLLDDGSTHACCFPNPQIQDLSGSEIWKDLLGHSWDGPAPCFVLALFSLVLSQKLRVLWGKPGAVVEDRQRFGGVSPVTCGRSRDGLAGVWWGGGAMAGSTGRSREGFPNEVWRDLAVVWRLTRGGLGVDWRWSGGGLQRKSGVDYLEVV